MALRAFFKKHARTITLYSVGAVLAVMWFVIVHPDVLPVDREFKLTTYHDDARGVTCWTWERSRTGLSCLPDSALKDAGADR